MVELDSFRFGISILVGEKLFFLGRHRCSLLLLLSSESMNLFTKVKEFSFLGRHRRSFIPFIFSESMKFIEDSLYSSLGGNVANMITG